MKTMCFVHDLSFEFWRLRIECENLLELGCMSVSVKWAVLKGLLALMEYLVAAAAVAGNEIEK